MPEEKPKEKPPQDLIPHEQLVPVIIDLQIIESHYQKMYQRPNLYKRALDSASYFVFEKHEVTKEQFETSYLYYAMDLPVMYMILETTLDSLNYRVSGQRVETLQ